MGGSLRGAGEQDTVESGDHRIDFGVQLELLRSQGDRIVTSWRCSCSVEGKVTIAGYTLDEGGLQAVLDRARADSIAHVQRAENRIEESDPELGAEALDKDDS